MKNFILIFLPFLALSNINLQSINDCKEVVKEVKSGVNISVHNPLYISQPLQKKDSRKARRNSNKFQRKTK